MVERFARIRPTGNIRANDSCSRMNRYFRVYRNNLCILSIHRNKRLVIRAWPIRWSSSWKPSKPDRSVIDIPSFQEIEILS
ncbi:unnamed protein product [Nesidiocoris tenuis]|uniref:Uncharacterized protein n=1 Tax=Nesidiocoris tenuis TaxID=355587 RepID=A0A6H5GJZ9_9HEMI|nr:unnamed protein product [Nesidiocoris tenuis]